VQEAYVRSIGLASLATLVLVAAAAAPVLAAPPTKEPLPTDSSEFAAGEVCDFAVRIDYVGKPKAITFDRRDGQFKQNLSGHLVATVTNLDTGDSVTRNASGPGKITVNAAGHTVLRFNGASVFTLFEGDVTGRGLVYMKGGGAEFEIGDDGFFYVRADFPKHVEDLCATLG
jgi:hypothetical protein